MSKAAREACLEQLAVSRETAAALDQLVDLLRHWQRKVNLVGPRTLDEVWHRHILDSGQILRLVMESDRSGPPQSWADLGAGAGFPGLVLAILGAQDMHLIESDRRKCAFLGQAARAARAGVTIHPDRIEKLAPLGAGIVTARALAPLETLIGLALRHLAHDGEMWFLKGAEAEEELTRARQCWTFEATLYRSLTSDAGRIIRLASVAPLVATDRGATDQPAIVQGIADG